MRVVINSGVRPLPVSVDRHEVFCDWSDRSDLPVFGVTAGLFVLAPAARYASC